MTRTQWLPIFLALCIFDTSLADDSSRNPCHQYYPNIKGTVLLENEKVVVQKFIFPPGQWEGVHSHPPDQIYIHIKGGEWTVRYGATTYPPEYSETGSVGWYGPVPLSADHESVNSGKEPIELIWITLKQGCLQKSADAGETSDLIGTLTPPIQKSGKRLDDAHSDKLVELVEALDPK